jgi:hypothetical protein
MIDPVWASAGSKFAILIGEWLRSDRMINIVYSEELNRPSYEEAIDHVFKLTKLLGNIKKYRCRRFTTRAHCFFKEKDWRKIRFSIYRRENKICKKIQSNVRTIYVSLSNRVSC